MYAIVVAVIVLGAFHVLLGLISVCVGVTSSIQAEVWLAHSVSPIWSGGFFTITGLMAFACARRKTAYMILCFTASSIVSLVTAIVSIQLLRLGMVNHTTDGHTFQKEETDTLIIIALGAAGTECLFCVISSFVSCRMAHEAKKELFKKREGTFHVQDEVDLGYCNSDPDFEQGLDGGYAFPGGHFAEEDVGHIEIHVGDHDFAPSTTAMSRQSSYSETSLNLNRGYDDGLRTITRISREEFAKDRNSRVTPVSES